MSNKQKTAQFKPVDVDAEETPEQNAERKRVCSEMLIFAEAKMLDIENQLLDNAHTGSMPQLFQQALQWSNIRDWVRNIMANRWIIPEGIEANKKASQVKEISDEDRRKANGIIIAP